MYRKKKLIVLGRRGLALEDESATLRLTTPGYLDFGLYGSVSLSLVLGTVGPYGLGNARLVPSWGLPSPGVRTVLETFRADLFEGASRLKLTLP